MIGKQIQQLKKLFALFDEDGSGNIAMEEINRIVERLGKQPTRDELSDLVKVIDYTGDGEVLHRDTGVGQGH